MIALGRGWTVASKVGWCDRGRSPGLLVLILLRTSGPIPDILFCSFLMVCLLGLEGLEVSSPGQAILLRRACMARVAFQGGPGLFTGIMLLISCH